MARLNYYNKGFTLVELIIYISIISILGLLTISILYSIILYSNVYLDKVSLRNESLNLLNKLYFNSVIATSIDITSSSIKFNIHPSGYERLFLDNKKIYLENESTTTVFTSNSVEIENFNVATSSDFYNVFIKMSNPAGNYSLSLTTTLYLWSF